MVAKKVDPLLEIFVSPTKIKTIKFTFEKTTLVKARKI